MTTTIKELQEKKYVEVDLPGWGVDDVFTVKLQRVNVFNLAAKGKIPNPLQGAIVELFNGTLDHKVNDIKELKVMNDLTEFFCDVVMVDPSYKEVEETIGMTDEQKALLYFFAIKGVKVIEPFLKKQEPPKSNKDGKAL